MDFCDSQPNPMMETFMRFTEPENTKTRNLHQNRDHVTLTDEGLFAFNVMSLLAILTNLTEETEEDNPERALVPYTPQGVANQQLISVNQPMAVTRMPLLAIEYSPSNEMDINEKWDSTNTTTTTTTQSQEKQGTLLQKCGDVFQCSASLQVSPALPMITWYDPHSDDCVLEADWRRDLNDKIRAKDILIEELTKQVKGLVAENGQLNHYREKNDTMETRVKLLFLENQILEEEIGKLLTRMSSTKQVKELENVKQRYSELEKCHQVVKTRNAKLEKYMDCILYTLAIQGFTHVEDMDGVETDIGYFEQKIVGGRQECVVASTKDMVAKRSQETCIEVEDNPGCLKMMSVTSAVSHLKSENEHLQKVIVDSCERERIINMSTIALQAQVEELQQHLKEVGTSLNKSFLEKERLAERLEEEKQHHENIHHANHVEIEHLRKKIRSLHRMVDSEGTGRKNAATSCYQGYRSRWAPGSAKQMNHIGFNQSQSSRETPTLMYVDESTVTMARPHISQPNESTSGTSAASDESTDSHSWNRQHTKQFVAGKRREFCKPAREGWEKIRQVRQDHSQVSTPATNVHVKPTEHQGTTSKDTVTSSTAAADVSCASNNPGSSNDKPELSFPSQSASSATKCHPLVSSFAKASEYLTSWAVASSLFDEQNNSTAKLDCATACADLDDLDTQIGAYGFDTNKMLSPKESTDASSDQLGNATSSATTDSKLKSGTNNLSGARAKADTNERTRQGHEQQKKKKRHSSSRRQHH
ncbi:uncharacterized protein LOC102802568 [Saccoglossus kowalevskii]